MYIHSVKLINFKSIGDYDESEIILEQNITAIIGKNESGKSNILDGLSRINFLKNNPSAFSPEIINRSSPSGSENVYHITLKPDSREIEEGLHGDTGVEISKSKYSITGAFLDYYIEHIYPYFESIVAFLDEIGTNPFQARDQELTNYKIYKDEFAKKDSLNLYIKQIAIDFFHTRTSRIPTEHQEEFAKKMNLVIDVWSKLQGKFPVFFYRKSDKHLNTSYKLDEIEKELKSPTAAPSSLLYDFVKLIGVSPADFIEAARSGSLPKQESTRRRINKFVNEKINIPFFKFYHTEHITLDIGFNGGVVSFVVQSEDGEALMLSERSNGLRWYLETFIDAQANDIAGSNVVYLLDEPGTSLHVNAQKELLELFQHLSSNGNQIVYTTHSPYMLNLRSDGVHRIRAIVKNTDGYTYIYKTAYDARISPDSQKDTLAPIINAIGMNLNDTFGPAINKLNIVTEGMSDYIYLCTMAKLLDVDTEKYAILPTVGASNCINVCSILHGWGCKYIAIFDYDKAGVETGGEYMRKEMMLEYHRQFCYLTNVSQAEIDNKTYKTSAFMIEDLMTHGEIDRFCQETNTSKTIGKPLMAKLISNAIESGTYEPGEECRSNFQKLFDHIFSCFG